MPLPNVAHEAGPNGKCARCGALIGEQTVLNDETGSFQHFPWPLGSLVLEYDVPGGRTAFTDSAAGPRVTCVP